MKAHIAELICSVNGSLELRENYSGRGMYGNTTTAIVFDSHNEFLAACVEAALNSDDFDEFLDEISRFSYDSMGLSKIVY